MGSVGRKPHHGAVKRIAILTAGWICLGLGIVGFFLPVLQGFLLIGLGLWLLSKESRLMKKFADRLMEKYPTQHQKVQAWKSRILAIFKK
jgi:uncharacterized membrane protein YbaN (DUF454 family)